MYKLKKLNVIKSVNSKFKADKLVQEGFTLLDQPIFEEAKTSAPKPSVVVEEKETNDMDCPYCEKTYKSEKALMNHIKDKHSED